MTTRSQRLRVRAILILCLAASWQPSMTPASAASPTLYRQLGGVATGYPHSMQTPARSDEIADDFSVPLGERWSVDEVQVQGTGSSSITAFRVSFYRDLNDFPGGGVASTQTTADFTVPTGEGGEWDLTIPPVRLDPGPYWVSVQGVSDDPDGQFGWQTSTTGTGNDAVMRSAGAQDCAGWTRRTTCAPETSQQPDQLFSLLGSSVSHTSDQQSPGGGDAASVGGFPWGQTFTAGLTGNLDEVDLGLYRSSGTFGNLTVEIYPTSNGLPTDEPLASIDLQQGSVSSSGNTVTRVPLVPAPRLIAGDVYAIAVSAAADGYLWLRSSADVYAGGNEILRTNGWTALNGDFAFHTYVLVSDATPPVTTATATTEGHSYTFGDWTGGGVVLSLSADDGVSGSGVVATYYSRDEVDCSPDDLAACSQYTGPFDVTGEGPHTVRYFSIDSEGNAETPRTATVRIDTSPPSTEASVSPSAFDTWTSGDGDHAVHVTLTAGDGDGSGVVHTYYSIDDDSCVPGSPSTCSAYSVSFPVTGEGAHTIVYFATDAAGNSEAQHSEIVKIDTTAPTSTIAGTVGSDAYSFGSWTPGDSHRKVTVTLSADDGSSTSGVDATYYGVGDSTCAPGSVTSCQSYTGPFDVGGSDGSYRVHFFSADRAGNVEGENIATVDIDTTSPTTTATGTVTGAPYTFGAWTRGPVQVGLSPADGSGSGVAASYYGVDASSCTTTDRATCTSYTAPVSLTAEGAHTLTYFSVDGAGNSEALQTKLVAIDSSNPTITLSAPTDGSIFPLHTAASGSYSCDDLLTDTGTEGSGVARCVDSRGGTVGSPAALDTGSVTGSPRLYTVTAEDGVGHTSSASAGYRVQYAPNSCSGSASRQILQPVNGDGTSIFPRGSIVLLKFRVCDANGVSIGTAGVVTGFKQLSAVAIPSSRRPNESLGSGKATGSFTWDGTNKLWMRRLGSASLKRHTRYTDQISLNDGTAIVFSFAIG